MKHVIEYDEECPTCSGTGLYTGFAKRSGAAIVCHDCKGTGKLHTKITYKDFEGLKHRKETKRVYQTNPGISIGTGNGHTLEEYGGLSYEDWKAGKKFVKGTEMRKYTCPTGGIKVLIIRRSQIGKNVVCVMLLVNVLALRIKRSAGLSLTQVSND